MKAKKILQFLSRSFAGLLFTVGFFLLFMSVFLSGLLENLPVLKSSLQENLVNEDFIAEQIAAQSGIAVEQVKEIFRKDPAQEGCEPLNNPNLMATSLVEEITNKINPYAQLINKLKLLMIFLFVLSLVFYFLGTMEIYAALFKISINTAISAVFGYIAFSSLSTLLPGIVDQAFNIAAADISQKLPIGFKENIIKVVNAWLEVPISNLNKLFIYLAAISLLTSILFYILKRKKAKR